VDLGQPKNEGQKCNHKTIVSAYSDGDVDIAFIGITPAIRMKHQGLPGKVTAANQTGGFIVLIPSA